MSSKKSSKLNRTFPSRVKNETKSRPQLPFKRFADFLTLRRKKKKGDDGHVSLEKQTWFHGKINAEYAEMAVKKSGEFLVREDPAMPGSWFIVVRTKETALHLAINKLKSSKGTRFKYRIEDSDFVFDSISELIRFYVNERRPVSIRPPAVITIAVSREAALLSEEDFRGRFATAGSARITRATRKVERKSSDPNLSTRIPSKLYEEIPDTPTAPEKERERLQPRSPSMSIDNTTSSKDTQREEPLAQSPRSRSLDNVLDDSTTPRYFTRNFHEESNSSMYDSPRTIATPTRVTSPGPYAQQEKKRKNIDMSLYETDTDYATPSSIPLPYDGEESSRHPPDRDILYDVPPSKNTGGSEGDNDDAIYINQVSDVKIETQENELKPTTQEGRRDIYLTVVEKLRDAIIQPFLRHDCVTLASHLTKADLEVVWSDSAHQDEEDGGAKGIEMLVLPQGREKRYAVLERYQNVTYWVGALVIAAGEIGSRAQMVTKLIELADVLSDKAGNLVSFMAIIDGLALPQVGRLHHTWSCLHHQHSKSANLFHSTLKPLAGLLSSGAPSPFPGVCLPYVVPLARLLEMTSNAGIEEWCHDDVEQGLEIMLSHLTSGRTLIQQTEAFKNEAQKRLNMGDTVEIPALMEYCRTGIDVGQVLGVSSDPALQKQKLTTLLNWLSETAEQNNKQP